MKVEFLSKFYKDIDKLKDSELKAAIAEIILQLEIANNLSQIPNTKKLKGHKLAYRIKLGDYRIGLFCEGNIVELARFVHRKDIYKIFP